MSRFDPEALRRLCTALLLRSGLPVDHAEQTAVQLVQTSLWGIDSHGVARLPHYLERLSRGSLRAEPKLSFNQTGGGTGSLDGDHGLGFVVCTRAMSEAMRLARENGLGAVGVFNSSHCGALGLYTRMAAKEGMIGIGFTHSDSFVAPHGGTAPFFGTNPLSLAMPSGDPERPFCVDMCTSNVPWNRVMNARIEGRALPAGWALDGSGKPTTDAHAARALLPMAEHKGFALAYAIELLCGPLNGMPAGPAVTPMYGNLDEFRRLGSFFMVLDPSRFQAGVLFSSMVAALIESLRASAPGARTPGDPEYACAEERNRLGIEIEPGLARALDEWSARLGLDSMTLSPKPF